MFDFWYSYHITLFAVQAKNQNEMNKQALELNNIKLELANAFIELDKKKIN